MLATDIYYTADAQSIAGFNSQPKACALFNRVTNDLKNSLNDAKFPALGNYYLMELEGDNMVVVVAMEDYQWGMLLDKTKVPLGLLLNVIIPKVIEQFKDVLKS